MAKQLTDLELLRLLARRLPTVYRKMTEMELWCGTGSSGGASRATGTSDRTGGIATNGLVSKDQVRGDRDELHQLEQRLIERVQQRVRITGDVTRMKQLVDRYDLSREDMAHMASKVPAGPSGCKSCQRIGKWSDLRRDGLCRFCIAVNPRVAALYEWDDPMPPVGVVQWHHDTGKGNVTEKVIHQVMFGQKRRTLDSDLTV